MIGADVAASFCFKKLRTFGVSEPRCKQRAITDMFLVILHMKYCVTCTGGYMSVKHQ